MPQGRRKVPFSGKAKKAQIQQKRERIENKPKIGDEEEKEKDEIIVEPTKDRSAVLMEVPSSKIELAGKSGGGRKFQQDANKYELRFNPESKKEIAAKREKARQPLQNIKHQRELELPIEDCFPESLDFPKRPPWYPSMSKIAMEANEAKYFRQYVEKIFDDHEESMLSFFELNLETWRQLWRVIEKSDILLFVVDARYPSAMFPPSMYRYVTSLGKHFILVLNKVDLIPAALALSWKAYFKRIFPEIHVAFFTSCPTYNLNVGALTSGEHAGLKFRRLRGRISMVTEGAKQIFDICRTLAEKGKLSISSAELDSWANKIQDAMSKGHHTVSSEEEVVQQTYDVTGDEKSGILAIGMVGQPNAGKSSLINSLMGKRVVSVSKTPGHTKHFQTIFITKSVMLVDCPGLVFPSLVPRQLQVLLGSYPIAQVREPFSIVQYIAERVDLPLLLRISHPDDQVTCYKVPFGPP